jgi:septin family protein
MEYYIYNDDEASPLKERNPYTPVWPFRMLIAGSSGSGKTNMLINLLLEDKLVKTYHNQEGGKRYISCNDVVLIGKHLHKPKWKNV